MYEFDMTKNRAAYKAHLDDIGVQTLPDQPGKRGFTAEEVKLHFKAPIDFLFALIGKNLNEMTSVLAKYDLTIEEAKKEIKELQTAIAKGVLFSPALQDTAPDPTQVRVWLDTSESEDTQEEIPKDDTVSTESEPQILTLDEETGSLTFEDGQELKAIQEDNEETLISSEDNEEMLISSEENEQLNIINEEEQETLPLVDNNDNNLTVIDDETEFKTMDS